MTKTKTKTKTIQLEGDKFKVVTLWNLTNRVVKLLERNLENICRNTIYADYLWEAILNSDLFIYHQTKSGQINGIMMIDIHKRHLFVEMICSKRRGLGSKLLKVAEKVAKQKEKKVVKLVSVKGAEDFYMKKGYLFTERPCVRSPRIKRKFDRNQDGYPMSKCII